MTALGNLLQSTGALILALAVIGCATAATLTGHLSGGDLLGVFAGTGGVGGIVTTAHVVGNQVNAANASSSTPNPSSTASLP